MERLFGLDAQLIFELCLTALAVFCLFMALSYILFNPVRDMLKKRQQMVQETKDTANKEKEDALRQKAAQLEQENQQLEEDISLLGSIESVMRIAQEKLGLMPPDSEIIVPQTEP